MPGRSLKTLTRHHAEPCILRVVREVEEDPYADKVGRFGRGCDFRYRHGQVRQTAQVIAPMRCRDFGTSIHAENLEFSRISKRNDA